MSDIRAALSPFLFISYMLGIRIIEFPAGEPRFWCSLFYIPLIWSIHYFLILRTTCINNGGNDTPYVLIFCSWLHNLIALLSVVLGMYHDKKYRTCLKQLDTVDDTLEKIGIITNYQKLYTKILLTVFGWFAFIICTTSVFTVWHKDYYSTLYSFYVSFMFNYAAYVNILDDMFITYILGYIELKFEQINEYIRKLDGCNGHAIKRGWEHSALLPCQSAKSTANEYATWVVIHLHLELCKISRELNSVFGLQMTIKMGVYFVCLATGFRVLFDILFSTKYNLKKRTLLIILSIIKITINIFRLFIINYMCEKVSIKANTTGNVINRIPYSISDVAVRENISQFLLQISLTPLKFYGLRFFKFGLNFFYGFSSSLSTVIVILVQPYAET